MEWYRPINSVIWRFKMSGPLISLNVDEGQKVRTGQIVAEIDPLDFKWEYEAKNVFPDR